MKRARTVAIILTVLVLAASLSVPPAARADEPVLVSQTRDDDDRSDGSDVDDRDDVDDPAPTDRVGKLDDGAELLPQARITLEQAIATARGAGTGPLGEVDLEFYHGKLVFNVDVGTQDVKVDATTGQVLAVGDE
ncbi:MAG: PepSY domain-containing protein [Candidatus Eremiobacterota bacterium]